MRAILGCLFFCIVVTVAGCAQGIQFNDPNLEAVTPR